MRIYLSNALVLVGLSAFISGCNKQVIEPDSSNDGSVNVEINFDANAYAERIQIPEYILVFDEELNITGIYETENKTSINIIEQIDNPSFGRLNISKNGNYSLLIFEGVPSEGSYDFNIYKVAKRPGITVGVNWDQEFEIKSRLGPDLVRYTAGNNSWYSITGDYFWQFSNPLTSYYTCVPEDPYFSVIVRSTDDIWFKKILREIPNDTIISAKNALDTIKNTLRVDVPDDLSQNTFFARATGKMLNTPDQTRWFPLLYENQFEGNFSIPDFSEDFEDFKMEIRTESSDKKRQYLNRFNEFGSYSFRKVNSKINIVNPDLTNFSESIAGDPDYVSHSFISEKGRVVIYTTDVEGLENKLINLENVFEHEFLKDQFKFNLNHVEVEELRCDQYSLIENSSFSNQYGPMLNRFLMIEADEFVAEVVSLN